MVNIHCATAETRRGKKEERKKEEETTGQKYNVRRCYAAKRRAAITRAYTSLVCRRL